MAFEEALGADMVSTVAWEPHPPSLPAYVIALKQFNKVLINVILTLIMLAMGCVVTFQDFKVVLRRPVGALIGLGCQFFIMPLTGFTLAHLLRLDPAFAIGVLITASSPGGVTSSLQTYWSRGDVCLSIVMTTVSTIAALGLLPFNLWLYSRSWTDSQTSIPYLNITIGLILIIIPVGVGMVIRWKAAKAARIISVIGSIGGFLMIGMNLAINCVINPRILSSSPWTLWLATLLLPCFGYTLGYLIALLLCQESRERRTISFEVGIQNVGVALSLISVSFDESPMFFDLITYPSLFAFCSVITSFSLVGLYRIHDKLFPEPEYTAVRDDVPGKYATRGDDVARNDTSFN